MFKIYKLDLDTFETERSEAMAEDAARLFIKQARRRRGHWKKDRVVYAAVRVD